MSEELKLLRCIPEKYPQINLKEYEIFRGRFPRDNNKEKLVKNSGYLSQGKSVQKMLKDLLCEILG